MTESALAAAPAPSIPPREVRIGILLQLGLLLRGFVALALAVVYGLSQRYPAAAVITVALVALLFAGICSAWLYGLWWRQNWVRWLTVIWNVFDACDGIHKDIVTHRPPHFLTYLLIAIQITATVILVRPVANHWYGHRFQ